MNPDNPLSFFINTLKDENDKKKTDRLGNPALQGYHINLHAVHTKTLFLNSKAHTTTMGGLGSFAKNKKAPQTVETVSQSQNLLNIVV